MAEKSNTPTLDKLLGRQEVINGKAAPKYVSVYLLISVSCANCTNTIAPQSTMWKFTVDDLQEAAREIHDKGIAAHKVLCAKPQLFITWGSAFMDSTLIK